MTIIGASLLITGEIISQEDITIHGRVKGQIRMEKGSLVVAEMGSVDADVEGARMTIHGTLAGHVAGAERIELTPKANVSGMLTTRAVVMHDGATFNGLIDVDRPTAKGEPPLTLAPATAAPIVTASRGPVPRETTETPRRRNAGGVSRGVPSLGASRP